MLDRVHRAPVRSGALVALVLFATSAPAQAGWLEGWQAVAEGRYADAVETWLAGAAAGDVDLQYNMGLMHESGLLGEADHEEAARWYRLAADRNLPAALHRLAGLAMRGMGMESDPGLAIDLLTRAAEAGYARSQMNLAVAHDTGIHVPPNPDLAVLWYHAAALQGLPEAQYGLARMAAMEQANENSHEQAMTWYRAAAEAGLAEAQNNLALMHEHGRGVPVDLETAAAWYRRAAGNGLAVAANNLGIMLQHGRGVEADHAAAAAWYLRAALAGNPSGQINLANAYANGLGIGQDIVEARAWILLAQASGDAAAREAAAEYGRRLEPRLGPGDRREAAARARSLHDDIAARNRDRERERLRPRPEADLGSGVVTAQRYLARLGYLDGPVDGIAGPVTVEAARRFLSDSGLPADSRINHELLAHLSEAVRLRAAATGAPEHGFH